jgi:SAM-dependent methyltransferase
MCGLQFIYPGYTQQDLDCLYNQPLYARFVQSTSPLYSLTPNEAARLLDTWRGKFLRAGLQSWLDARPLGNRAKLRFLDVGCGRGHNLLIFDRLGFDVEGIELSEGQADYVQNILKYRVHRTDIHDFNSTKQYDCILAAHVLEHVNDPHAFVRSLKKCLAPDGLLILETPLVNDWGQELDRYRDIYHTMFFDFFTLALLGEMNGLRFVSGKDVMWSAGSYCVDIVACYQVASKETAYDHTCPSVENFRAAYDLIQCSYLFLARHYLAVTQRRTVQRLMRDGLTYMRRFGFRAAMKRTSDFIKRWLRD